MQQLDACGMIMAGGQSRRMGTNKALLPFQGRPLIARVAERLTAWFRQVVIVTNTPEVYRFLDLPMVGDRVPGLGPLGGIEAGLSASTYRAAFVAACDMPFLDRDLAAYLVGLADAADLVVPMLAGQPEPLHAVYTRDCLPVIARQIATGDYRLARLFPQVRTRMVTETDLRRFGPPERLFFNCNTPDDLARALRLAAEENG